MSVRVVGAPADSITVASARSETTVAWWNQQRQPVGVWRHQPVRCTVPGPPA